MVFAICYNEKIERAAQVRQVLEKALPDAQILDIDHLQGGADFVFVIGGDGTILKAARFFAPYGVPIFGINLGRLGFLSHDHEVNAVVKKIINGEYKVQDRIMLKSGSNIALNDFVIKGCAMGRTSRFSLKINDKTVCNYLADGVIIATPTGSTAYGLSAGGPVLEPTLGAFVIVPICAHTLSARPLVVPDYEKISICTDAGVVSADGQEFYESAGEIIIEKSGHCARLALLDDTEFYPILRDKLHWGISPAKC
jgi:NAD+ kinase